MGFAIGDLLKNTTTAKPDEGLEPNKFQLQMFGPNATVAQRPAIGFDKPDLRSQVPGGAVPTAPTAAPQQQGDPFAAFGPFGAFFSMIDRMRLARGESPVKRLTGGGA